MLSAIETPRGAVQFEGELGRGQSGEVSRATVPAPGSDRGARQRVPVAAKVAVLPGGAHPSVEERSTIDTALLVEALLLVGLKHPHVVGLVTIVVDTTPAMLCKSPALRQPVAGPRAVAARRWRRRSIAAEHCCCPPARPRHAPSGALGHLTHVWDGSVLKKPCWQQYFRVAGADPLPACCSMSMGTTARAAGTELMVNGDLKTFLRACRHDAAPSVAKTEITALMMHQMASRLASAMAFLERCGIVHRDIAVSAAVA